MVRQFVISDIENVSQLSNVIKNYSLEQIDFEHSEIQLNDETGEIEWFYIMSTNHECPEYFLADLDEGFATWEIVDIYCVNDKAFDQLEEHFCEFCKSQYEYTTYWCDYRPESKMEKYLDKMYLTVESYDMNKIMANFNMGHSEYSEHEIELLNFANGKFRKFNIF